MMGAPKGNKFAVGNSGKPKLFESPEALQKEIDRYFDDSIADNTPVTIEGLCVFLNITRQTLLNYEKEGGYNEYFDVIKMAKQKITANMITRGLMNEINTPLTIFLLKNQGYSDKQEIEHSGEVNSNIQVNVYTDKAPPLANDENEIE